MVEGLDRLKRKMTIDIPRRVRAAAEDALEQNAKYLTAEMRRLVPVDQGELRQSITYEETPDRDLSVTITAGDETTVVTNSRGVRFQNALIQEYGTSKNPGNPFFFTSYRKLKRKMKGRITRSIRKAIREGAK